MNIISASTKHASQAAPLIRLSGPKAFDYVFKNNRHKSNTEFLQQYFATAHTIFSFKHHYVLIHDNTVIGTFSLTSKQDHDNAFFAMAYAIFKHYGLAGIVRGLLFEMRLVRPPKKGRLCISHISIDPAYQGKGFAGHIMAFADKVAANHQFQYLALDVRSDNTNAIKLYENNGYKAIKYNKSFTKQLDDHIYMEKSVNR